MGILISLLKSVGVSVVKALVTKKVALRLSVILLEKAIDLESTGPALDKAILCVKEEIEKIK